MRETWQSKWGFILACIGSAVGMGNAWLFPYRLATYGGSFLLMYLIFTFLIGITGVIGEMNLGRATRSGPVGAFSVACASRGASYSTLGKFLGTIPLLGVLALATGYAIIVGWILKYTVESFTGSMFNLSTPEAFVEAFSAMAQDFGNNYYLLLGLLLTFLIMSQGISKGIEKANKIMIPLFYIMFVGLAVYVAFQDGADAGYAWMFTLDYTTLANPLLHVYALGQAFFTLSLAGSGTIIYGSYLSEDTDTLDAAWKIALFSTLAAILAALVIIPAMATTGAKLSTSGPGLLFISMPQLFSHMPGGQIIMLVFFVAVLFAGLTSLVNLFEAPLAVLQDRFKFTRFTAVLLVAFISSITALVIQGTVAAWMDFISIYVVPLGAALAGIMFAWVWGRAKVETEVSKGRARPIGSWYYPTYKYLFCFLTLIVFICGIVFNGIG